MFGIFRKAPRAGDTDEAARRIMGLMEREEREKQALRRLKAEGWRPPDGGAQSPRERRFGDGRDDLMQLVQSGLDEHQARQDEARRRVQMAQAGSQVPLPPRKPMAPPASPFSIPPQKPESIGQAPKARTVGSDLLYGPIDRSRNVETRDRAKFRSALEMRGDLTPSMRAALDYVFDFEGGYKPHDTAMTGIEARTLNEYLADLYKTNPEMRRVWQDRRFMPAQLSDQQRIAFMRWYGDNRTGDIDIGGIESPRRSKSFGDPKLAALIFDSMYRYGKGGKDTTEGVTRPIQKAINDTLLRYWSDVRSTGVRTRLHSNMPNRIDDDNQPGPETRNTIGLLLDAGYADELRAAINEQIHKMNTTWTTAERTKLIDDGYDPDEIKKVEEANDAYRRLIFR